MIILEHGLIHCSDHLIGTLSDQGICQENDHIRLGVQQLQNKINQFQRRDGLGGSPLIRVWQHFLFRKFFEFASVAYLCKPSNVQCQTEKVPAYRRLNGRCDVDLGGWLRARRSVQSLVDSGLSKKTLIGQTNHTYLERVKLIYLILYVKLIYQVLTVNLPYVLSSSHSLSLPKRQPKSQITVFDRTKLATFSDFSENYTLSAHKSLNVSNFVPLLYYTMLRVRADTATDTLIHDTAVALKRQ